MKLKNVKFRQSVDVKPLGSCTLGFLDATFVTKEADIEVNDMVIRLTVDGAPSIAFARREWTQNGEKRSKPTLRLPCEQVYAALVKSVFALDSVKSARAEAIAQLKERAAQSA